MPASMHARLPIFHPGRSACRTSHHLRSTRFDALLSSIEETRYGRLVRIRQ